MNTTRENYENYDEERRNERIRNKTAHLNRAQRREMERKLKPKYKRK